MLNSKRIISIFASLLILLLVSSGFAFQSSNIPTPESVIGFKPGTEYRLANWDQISRYFNALGEASDRIEVTEVGKTPMGNPMLVALISSPENLRNKERIKDIQHKLADPRKTRDSELPALVREGKTVVLMTFSLHGSECGASQMSNILAYQLATQNDPITRQILDNVMIVMFPSANPDGVQLIADHYMSYINKGEMQPPSLPRVYNKYVGHDNNRDWYMLTQDESKLIAHQLYDVWQPEIVFDMHQMGNSGARFFLPPFADPINPVIHPLIVRQLALIGGYFSTDLIAEGYPWVENQSRFSMWWHGGMRTAPYFHNMIGILTEAASANLASPVPPRPNAPAVPATINYPVPWQHDRPWTITDIVEQDRVAALALLKAAARNKDMFLNNYYIMNKDAIEKGNNEKPFAYIIPPDQHDKGATVYFLEIMLKQATEFKEAVEDFYAGGKRYPKGSIIAYLAQPARPHVEAIFSTQKYPSNLGQPYDITGWTLPLQMGVEYDKIDSQFEADTRPYDRALPVISGYSDEKPKTFYLGVNSIDHFRAVNRLVKNKYKGEMLTEPFELNGITLQPGSFVFKKKGKIEEEINRIKEEMSLTLIESKDSDKSGSVKFKAPRIAMIDNPRSMDLGWMRWLLEDNEFDYSLLYTDEILEGKLNKNYDVILVTTQPISKDDTQTSDRRRGTEGTQTPGEASLKIREFVEKGGTAVSWGRSANYLINALGLDIQSAVPRAERRKFNIPGSVLKININTEHPVTYGMQDETYIFFRRNDAWKAGQGTVLGRFPSENPLVSGFTAGDDFIISTPGVIYEKFGKGKVVLINFEPTFRAQPVSTFKLVFNSIYHSVIDDR
ncbi:MAG: hypothetical protein GY863_02720 [bacterium]|nr:hypothetical protein [bacterium]